MPRPSFRQLRLGFLIAALVLTALWACAVHLGWDRWLEPPPFTGRLEPGYGVVVETVDLLSPPARLVVARVPRGKGLRLRAMLADDDAPGLARLGDFVPRDALAAVNGDMHRLQGFCAGTTFSTLIDQGRAPVVGSPFSYACAFALERDGTPRIGPLDLSIELALPAGEKLTAFANLEDGPLLLITRPQTGAWSAPFAGWSLERVAGTLDDEARYRLVELREPDAPRTGPALLWRPGRGDALATLAQGDEVRAKIAGKDAGRFALAIGTGPRLLEGGKPAAVLDAPSDGGWDLRVPRTAIGLSPTEVLLVVTPQGARMGLGYRALANALAALGCTDAIALDGGPSSALYAGGRVVSTLPDGDDPVASALVVLTPGGGDPGVR